MEKPRYITGMFLLYKPKHKVRDISLKPGFYTIIHHTLKKMLLCRFLPGVDKLETKDGEYVIRPFSGARSTHFEVSSLRLPYDKELIPKQFKQFIDENP